MTVRERRSEPDELGRHAVPADDATDTLEMEPGAVKSRPPPMPSTHSRQRGELISRYVLLSPAGAGGMGEVYSAYDPSLDRRIALKLIKPVATENELMGARALLVAEAHALAKLSHPNVVAVYDVGTDGNDVYLGMEYVEGTTLTAWLVAQRRPWSEIVAMFVEAGRGLDAAHRAGIVHRDFKPDNVLIGTDGRVRVIDFGIAMAVRPRAAGEAAGPNIIAGTPSFMAPEQFAGGHVGPHSDQFAFAVALYQALWIAWPFAGKNDFQVGESVTAGRLEPPPESSVPAPVRDAVMRALSHEPSARFSSMAELIAALQPPPPRRVGPYVLMGATAAVAVAGAAVLALRAQGGNQVCTGFSRDLAGVWDPTRKETVRAAVREEAWPGVERVFDAYAEELVSRKVSVCRATSVTGEQTAAVMERRMACLDTRRRELDAAVTLVAAGGAPSGQAMEIAGGLHTIAGCDNLASLMAPPDAPPAEIHAVEDLLARVRALRLAGDYRDARVKAQLTLDHAQRLQWGNGEARALVERGLSESADGDPRAARETLFEAIRRGDAAADPASQAAAWIGLVYVEAVGLRAPREALRWAKHAEGALVQAGSDQDGHATLLHNVAAALHALGREADALDHEQRALVLYRHAFGPRHVRVATQMGVVAQALRRAGRLPEALAQGEAAVSLLEDLLGPNHKSLAPTLNNLAVTYDELDRRDDARRLFERALAIKETEIGAEHVSLAIPLSNLAALERRLGDFDAADRLLSRAYDLRVAALGPNHPDVTRILQTKLLDRTSRGLDEEARTLVDDVIARQKARTEAVELAGALALRCELDRRAGRLAAAAASCREAVHALGETPDPNRACYVYVYAARLAQQRGYPEDAVGWLAKARAALDGVTRDKSVAGGYVGWAAAHIAAAAGRREEAATLATSAREALLAHGQDTAYVVADLTKLQ